MTRTLIAFAFLAFASAASASGPITITYSDPPQARITYDDVNLRSLDGRATVKHRIRLAAERVCVNDVTNPIPLQPYNDCYQIALGSGLKQLKQIASE